MTRQFKKKKTKAKKTIKQILLGYVRTFCISLFVAIVFTVFLSLHARNAMLKNLYANMSNRQKIGEQIAKQIIVQNDFIRDLESKSFSICVNVGNLYESASDYYNAQKAYEMALKKIQHTDYNLYLKLTRVLIAQEKFDEAKKILDSVIDVNNKNLIKFKTRSYIDMGDKYFSIGKFLSAAKSYEKAEFYYNKFAKKDKLVEQSIIKRISSAYVETADVMVRNGLNSNAVKYLLKAEKYLPDDFSIKYKLAIIYCDLDPVSSIKYFEWLCAKRPQDIDSGVYAKALMNAANVKEWQNNSISAKQYRYRIHSLDIFNQRKVVFKNDIEIYLDKFVIKKAWLKYHLNGYYRLKNVSQTDINNLYAEFNLKSGEKTLETVTVKCVSEKNPLYSNGGVTEEIKVNFGKNIFTKKELMQYTIDIYLYKDKKYKTLISSMKVPSKTTSGKSGLILDLEMLQEEF